MTVEIEVDEEYEMEVYPNGLDKNTMDQEMRADFFDELFFEGLSEYRAKGYLLEDGEVVLEHHVDLLPNGERS